MTALPPSLPQSPIVQFYRWAKTPIEFLDDCHQRLGEPFTIRWPGAPPTVVFSHPDQVKEILAGDANIFYGGVSNAITGPVVGKQSIFLSDGDVHTYLRRLVAPPFTGARMRAYGDVMREIADEAVSRWPRGKPFQINPAVHEISLDVVMRTIFGVEKGESFERLRSLCLQVMTRSEFFPLIQAKLGLFRPVLSQIDAILYAEIARSRAEAAQGVERQDVLHLLVSSRDESGKPLTDQALRDNLVTLLLAGHETTATTLAWTFYRLTKHPEVLAKAREEIARVVGRGPVKPDDVAKLEYLEGVIKETLRLFPILPLMARDLQAPARVGDWDLPKDTCVIASTYLTHRRADVWPDPERFDPMRFVGTRVSPYAFYPFGGGTRLCIGMSFAYYEMKIVIAQALTQIVPRPVPGFEPRVIRTSTVLAPSDGMPVILESA